MYCCGRHAGRQAALVLPRCQTDAAYSAAMTACVSTVVTRYMGSPARDGATEFLQRAFRVLDRRPSSAQQCRSALAGIAECLRIHGSDHARFELRTPQSIPLASPRSASGTPPAPVVA